MIMMMMIMKVCEDEALTKTHSQECPYNITRWFSIEDRTLASSASGYPLLAELGTLVLTPTIPIVS